MKALFVLAVLALVFFAGGYVGQATFEPQVIVETVEVFHEQTKPQVINEPVEEVTAREPQVINDTAEVFHIVATVGVFHKHVEKVPVKLRDFDSLEELKAWLREQPILIRLDSKSADCENFALGLQQKALKDGYLMSFEAIWPAEYNELFKEHQLSPNRIHAINLVIIGNNVYYIEPFTDEVVLAGYLD